MSQAPAVTHSSAALLAEKIRSRTARVGVVGLGYVGLPLAVEFAKAGFQVTGIDVAEGKTQRVKPANRISAIFAAPISIRW